MTTPLSAERLAEIRRHVMHTGPTDLGHVIGTALTAPELLAEVERLRSWLRECSVAMGGDGSDDSLLGLVYCCGAGNEALKQIGREQAEVDRLRARVAELEALLRSVEWGGGLVNRIDDMDGTYLGLVPTCPKCLELKSDGHAPDCELAAVLREAE